LGLTSDPYVGTLYMLPWRPAPPKPGSNRAWNLQTHSTRQSDGSSSSSSGGGRGSVGARYGCGSWYFRVFPELSHALRVVCLLESFFDVIHKWLKSKKLSNQQTPREHGRVLGIPSHIGEFEPAHLSKTTRTLSQQTTHPDVPCPRRMGATATFSQTAPSHQSVPMLPSTALVPPHTALGPPTSNCHKPCPLHN
jgi:hypothetical protein